MILVYTVALALVMSLGAFGRLRTTEIHITRGGALAMLFALQAALRAWANAESGGGVALLAWGLVMLGLAAMLFENRGIVGMPLVLMGVLANLLVVVANDGMPVAGDALDTSSAFGGFYQPSSVATQLEWLGDILPDPSGKWLMSLGDLLLIVGAATVIVSGSGVGTDAAEAGWRLGRR